MDEIGRFSLFSGWNLCSHCKSPPVVHEVEGVNDQEKHLANKLPSCSKCHSAAYHSVECQQAHWAGGHKQDCKNLQKAIKPLEELMGWFHCDNDYTSWLSMDMMAEFYADTNNELWQRGVKEWNYQNYLEALRIFQSYLLPYKRAWCAKPDTVAHGKKSFYIKEVIGTANEALFCMSALKLAKRLLFCSYCEMDGEQVESARQRLVQCLSLLVTIRQLHGSPNDKVKITMDDAWMELALSMEEVPSDRVIARHVAKMAVTTHSCNWTNPLQRPGFVAKVTLDAIPFIPRDKHPNWCKHIESNWEHILKEYQTLAMNDSRWHDVGSGVRGTGHDDHMVVTGRRWTEYVLFGSGSTENDAPITKKLIREHLPDAVSLAEMGGGEVIFSRLEGDTHINSHCGPTNIRWTAHLGLIVPRSRSDCRIRVADQWYNWEAGKVLLFDDSFEHEVVNDTPEDRIVLLIRLWHPQLEGKNRLEAMMKAIAKKEENVVKRYHPAM
ncbi:hypothetical protein ACHAXN_011778 [Cyclotella atomus]